MFNEFKPDFEGLAVEQIDHIKKQVYTDILTANPILMNPIVRMTLPISKKNELLSLMQKRFTFHRGNLPT